MTDEHAELQRLIDRNLRAALQSEAAAAQILPQIEAVVGRGMSNGGVRSMVDHRGLVTDLALSPASVELPLEELRAEVLASVSAAIADAQSQTAPLQAQIAVDARPLDDMSMLDALDSVLRGGTAAQPSRPTGGSL